ncbi:MAG: protoporphyrinogen oxidase [Actinomycetota bacterium]|nr:protoporphyrinogen oxidase [Actinomycetota bacterium]
MSHTEATVVGGGITGLAAAWELARGGARVTLLESSPRLGGKIMTEEFRGRAVDMGPDAFLARLPEALQLCHELGLGEELLGVATEAASLWVRGRVWRTWRTDPVRHVLQSRGRLRPVPAGAVLGAPTSLAALARSRVVPARGVARAALDLVLPGKDLGPDPTVGDIVTARFGREVHQRLVDPLVGGIHAGPSARLSARAVAPQLATGAASHRSLLLGLRRASAPSPASSPSGAGLAPAFVSLRRGLGHLVARLEEALRAHGVHIQLGRAADLPSAGTRNAVIVTTPAPAAAALVAGASPEAAAELAAIEHSSVVLVVLSYPVAAFAGHAPPPGSGFLVPQVERRLMTACSFGSSKWPHWANEDEVVLRVSAGRWGDERAMALDDAELVARLHHELEQALGLRREPLAGRVTRWAGAFPQYRPGHLARVARIEAALARDAPSVQLAGAALRGVGIPACIAQGRAAARRALGLTS